MERGLNHSKEVDIVSMEEQLIHPIIAYQFTIIELFDIIFLLHEIQGKLLNETVYVDWWMDHASWREYEQEGL